MAGWVGAIAHGYEANWATCKQHGLWGTNSRRGGAVERGDELFIWQSKAGWLAHSRATSTAREPKGVWDVPWPEPEQYKYLFDIEVLRELAPPTWMPGAELTEKVGLHTIQLGQFPALSEPDGLETVRTVFESHRRRGR